MRRLLRPRIFAFTLLLALPSARARAGDFSLGAGAFFPQGNLADVASTGWHAQLGYGFEFGPLLVEPTVRYMQAPGEADALDLKIYGGEIAAQLDVLAFYLVGAVGYYRVDRSLDVQGLARLDEWKPSFSAGLGLDVGPVFVEARYMRVATDERSTRLFPVTVGWRF